MADNKAKPDANEGAPAPKKKKKKKAPARKGGFLQSKEMKRLYIVLAVPVVALLGWYAYTVAFELNKPQMSKLEAELANKAKALAQRAIKEGFRPSDVDRCKRMIDEYTTPKGWTYTDADIYQLVGLPKTATEQQMQNRCIYYAKAVSAMEKMSHHTRHVFVCGQSIFDISGNGEYYLKADPQGRGYITRVSAKGEQLVTIRPGTSNVLKQWQIYNVGDGCIIIGLSKTGAFKMSGQVSRR